ncbi:MAG TPA: AsmA-like C-terminal region-containing protein, partial [Micavibrio sp.]
LDLKFNAKTIEYGNWTLSDAALGATLKDGTLTIGQMNAGVYGGTMGLTATLRSTGKDRDPVSFNVKTNFKDVGLEPLAASFSGARPIKARGDVSLDLEAQSSGISPAALISALNGKGDIDGKKVVFEGFDLAAMSRSLVSTTKVFDNISGLVGASTKGGETSFDTIEGPFTIAEGVINFDNFLMKGSTANIASKGQISLPRWFIDMNSSIDLAQPEDAPNLDMRFQGPLDNPGNTFAGQAMQSYVQGRVNQKLQKVIGDKIGGKNPELNNLLNSVLGGGAQPPSAPAATPQPINPAQAPIQEQQIAPSSGETSPTTEMQAQPQPAPQPEQKKLKPEEEIMKGVLQGIMGGH